MRRGFCREAATAAANHVVLWPHRPPSPSLWRTEDSRPSMVMDIKADEIDTKKGRVAGGVVGAGTASTISYSRGTVGSRWVAALIAM